MPRKWRQSDYDDDGYGEYDEDDYYDDEEEDYAKEKAASTSSAAMRGESTGLLSVVFAVA